MRIIAPLIVQVIRQTVGEHQIAEHHLHILLHALHLLEQGALLVRVRVLQQQAHGGDGRFDLVRPDGVILHQLLIALLAARQLCAAVGIERAHERLILRLERTVRLGQLLGAERDLLLQPPQQSFQVLLRDRCDELGKGYRHP